MESEKEAKKMHKRRNQGFTNDGMCAIFSPGMIDVGVDSFRWGKKEPYSLWRNILCRLLIRKRQFRKKKAVLHGCDRTRGARLANMLFSGAGVPLIGMFQDAAPFFVIGSQNKNVYI